MTAFKLWLKENYPFALLSFFIPFFMMMLVYGSIGIYWGSSRSILASDAFAQYSNFHASFNNMLHGRQSIFFSWNASLGLNYLSFMSYYLGGIFTPLVFFFNNRNIPDALYLITLLKIACAGLSFWFFASQTYRKLPKLSHVTLAVAYSMMSFITAYSELVTWLDTFVWLPLVILGIHRLLEKRGNGLLFVAYLLIFTSNFYFGYMIGIYSLLFFSVKVLANWREYRQRIFPFILTAGLSAISSLIIILPMFLDLRANGEELSQIVRIKTEATNVWDILMKNMIGAYDTTKYGSIPFIYIGLFALIFAVFFFVTRNIKWKEKLGFGLILAFLTASFYLQWLNLAWQGFHSPNMFLFRFAYLFSFTIIYLAGYGLQALNRPEMPKLFGVMILLSAAFVVAYTIAHDQYEFITHIMLIATVFFIILYLLAIFSFEYLKFPVKTLAILLLTLVTIEAGLNTHGMINGILNDWNYASRSLYSDPHDDIQTLVNQANKTSPEFFRLSNLDAISPNDSLNFGYSDVSFFSSMRNRHSSSFLNELGFKSAGTNLNIRYANNTILMDSLVGMRFNIAKSEISKYGFEQIGNSGAFSLFQNENALPLGVMTGSNIFDFQLEKQDNLTNQRNLFNLLANDTEDYFSFMEPTVYATDNLTIINTSEDRIELKPETSQTMKSITYTATIPAGKQAAISLFPTSRDKLGNVTIVVDGRVASSQMNITGQYYNLGYFPKERHLIFDVQFTNSETLNLIKPQILLTDLTAFQRSVDRIRENPVSVTHGNRSASFEVTATEEQPILFTTIPKDSGWTARIDGQRVDTQAFSSAFLTVKVPPGRHRVEFTYLPPGFSIGLACFGFGVGSFILINYRKAIFKKVNNRKDRDYE